MSNKVLREEEMDRRFEKFERHRKPSAGTEAAEELDGFERRSKNGVRGRALLPRLSAQRARGEPGALGLLL